ncbi:MAG TPA: prephenate dehydrogenase [Anaerolineae bacterium]|nr:prephenate dehydrogenase [Anaerolineae bacterium]HNU03902.1 prephenate dehydrogenase [Anaerolineae bacterium]
MAKPRITIIGLGLIGASIGLALSRQQRDFEIIGHDKSGAAADRAKKLGAVDKTEWNLINACDGAGLVILALPLGAIRETMQTLAGELAEGAVILDTASVKAPVLAWAKELLPASVAFIGTHPIVASDQAGTAAARADLFDHCSWAICPSPTTDERAVKSASDLATRLGAQPHFLDAVEHDGLTAAVEQLPALASMALLTSAVSQPVWREMRRLAGGQFESSTRLLSTDSTVFSDAMLYSPEQVLRWIDSFIDSMATWREVIAAGDNDTIQQAFADAAVARDRWLSDRSKGNWEEPVSAPVEHPGILANLFGMGRRSPKRQPTKPA